MGSLWKKETNRADAQLVDLFANIGQKSSVQEWDRQIKSSNWKHRFLMTAVDAGKNNSISDNFRANGNMYFKQKLWVEAMEFYSQSLYFAETGTNNVSFAYANRATCFLNMKEYEKCLKDIDLAVEAKYPEHLMSKLMKRKADCVNLMKKNPAVAAFDPKLSLKASEPFPCMADALEIQRNDEFGRHLVAKCDIDVGQTILVEENFASIASGYDRVNCFECIQTKMNFMPCTECSDALFCSADCRDRSEIHKVSCGATIHRMPNNVRYIARSILVALKSFTNANDMMDFVANILSERATKIPAAANDVRSKYALFLSLQPASPGVLDIETVYKVFKGLLEVPSVKAMFESKQSQRFLMHLIGEHFLIISNNSYGGSLSSASSIGTTALVMSLFNHACAPNVFNSSMGNKEVCITMRPIKKGQQLFVKYLCGDRTTRQRQDMLLNQWGFLCKCDKCVPHCSPGDRSKMKSDPCFKALVKSASINFYDITNFSQLTNKCVQFLKKYGHLPWSEEMDVVLKAYTKCLLDPFPDM
ncbi:SET and MYND domain-containing protein 4-like [Sitodiplosis mosellana]|uniref:SET and MYND domain-containing protein 4-like n=1 Tax=Sitodiplosis mosellana TaxID=263140 RepID=UPI0024449E72|nr:SET and MYND domain-containing protein 4-like [Sitodiplosis mosellana]